MCYNTEVVYATVAQLAEQLIRNQQVRGSNPRSSSKEFGARSRFTRTGTVSAQGAIRPVAPCKAPKEGAFYDALALDPNRREVHTLASRRRCESDPRSSSMSIRLEILTISSLLFLLKI